MASLNPHVPNPTVLSLLQVVEVGQVGNAIETTNGGKDRALLYVHKQRQQDAGSSNLLKVFQEAAVNTSEVPVEVSRGKGMSMPVQCFRMSVAGSSEFCFIPHPGAEAPLVLACEFDYNQRVFGNPSKTPIKPYPYMQCITCSLHVSAVPCVITVTGPSSTLLTLQPQRQNPPQG